MAWFLIKWALYLAWKAIMVAWKGMITVWKIATDYLLSTVIMPVITWIKTVVVTIWDGIVWLAQAAWDGLQALGEWFKDLYEDHIKPALDELYAGLKDTWEELQQVYKDVVADIQYVWDHTIGFIADIWAKIEARIEAVAALVGLVKKEWAEALLGFTNWVNTNIFRPLEDWKRTIEDRFREFFDYFLDPLDTALSKIAWLKDLWDNHIVILKSLVHPTIEAPQLLGKETCVKTTIIYGDQVPEAMDGTAWVPPDNPTIVKMERSADWEVAQYWASEILKGSTGILGFALDYAKQWAFDTFKLEVIKTTVFTAKTLDFFYPDRNKGEAKIQELSKE